MSLLFVANYCKHDKDLAMRLSYQMGKLGYPIILIPDEGLKSIDVAQWCRRYLSVARGLKADYLIKLDPDAYVRDWVLLREMPDADVFGNVQQFRGGKFPLGGAFGMRTEAAIRMYGALNQPGLNREARLYKQIDEHGNTKYEAPIEEDVLSIVATRLKLQVADWHSIKCVYRPYQSPNQDYSIIHPVAY